MPNSLYSDVNQFEPTKKPLLLDTQSIYQSLYNILTTNHYQRLFNNAFGLDFEDELFELVDDVTTLEIMRVIALRIEEFEPRVTLNFNDTKIIPDPDNNRYYVTLVYSIVGQGDEQSEFKGIVSK